MTVSGLLVTAGAIVTAVVAFGVNVPVTANDVAAGLALVFSGLAVERIN